MRSMVLNVATGAMALAACAGSRVATTPAAPPPAAAAAPVEAEERNAVKVESAEPARPPDAPAADVAKTVATAAPTDAQFEATVRPLLARNCTPCHVPGGKMYDRMPFDQPKTVVDFQAGILRRLKVPEEHQAVEDWLKTAAAR
jgi:hypothetical protein